MNSQLKLDTWNPEVKKGVNDFLNKYGKSSALYSSDSYAVFDWDNTVSIFDIQDQALIYQLETMSFALSPLNIYSELAHDLDDEFLPLVWDITNAYTYLYTTYGPLDANGVSESQQSDMQDDPYWLEFAAKMLYAAQKTSGRTDNWRIRWFTGISENDVYEMAFRSCTKYRDVETSMLTLYSPEFIESKFGPVTVSAPCGIGVTDNMKELWKALNDNGIDVWVCSASEVNQIRAAVDTMGLHSLCKGVTAKTMCLDENGLMTSYYDYEHGCGWLANDDGTWTKDNKPTRGSCRGTGKNIVIDNAIAPYYHGRGPLAGFMDATGEFNFCTEYSDTKLVICFNCADKNVTNGGALIAEIAILQNDFWKQDFNAADENGDTYYVLQGRNENDMRIFLPQRESVVFDASQAILFKTEECALQLKYMTENKMTVRDVINKFAMKTKADDSANPLGFAYGFLSEYNGYHSR